MSINHREEAEALLKQAAKEFITEGDPAPALAAAQVHATLARDEDHAAATSDLKDVIALLRRREYVMRELVSTHIAKGLASREGDRWKAAINLSKALDDVGCGMDDLVDGWLEENGWDPRSAYKALGSLVPSDDSWAVTPDITAEVPEPVRRVIAGHLAEALLGGQSEDVRQWARGVTFELKRVGADLTGDIEKRISELTLGRDPSEPPF